MVLACASLTARWLMPTPATYVLRVLALLMIFFALSHNCPDGPPWLQSVSLKLKGRVTALEAELAQTKSTLQKTEGSLRLARGTMPAPPHWTGSSWHVRYCCWSSLMFFCFVLLVALALLVLPPACPIQPRCSHPARAQRPPARRLRTR